LLEGLPPQSEEGGMKTTDLTSNELAAWNRYIHEICGIYLDESKDYLIKARLTELLRETASENYAELLYKVKAASGTSLRTKVIDAITTNETSFFRDTSPFELLKYKIFPELIDRRTKAGLRPIPIRILSAACSTGQEIYSTAITLKELLYDFKGYDIRILGIDISDKAIAQASYAHFSRLEIDRGMAPDKLSCYFESSGERWKIRDELRALATFRRGNLLEPIVNAGPFDIVFCRNIAIYFNEPDKIRLFNNIGRIMAHDGSLIIGSTESIGGLCPEFEPKRYLRTVFYQKKAI
jgi:chemotaxis protein methyltransferase CheR